MVTVELIITQTFLSSYSPDINSRLSKNILPKSVLEDLSIILSFTGHDITYQLFIVALLLFDIKWRMFQGFGLELLNEMNVKSVGYVVWQVFLYEFPCPHILVLQLDLFNDFGDVWEYKRKLRHCVDFEVHYVLEYADFFLKLRPVDVPIIANKKQIFLEFCEFSFFGTKK